MSVRGSILQNKEIAFRLVGNGRATKWPRRSHTLSSIVGDYKPCRGSRILSTYSYNKFTFEWN